MNINLRRGMVRLWVVFALMWALGVAAASFRSVKREFDAALPAGFKLDVPAICTGPLQGKKGTDYEVHSDGHCWYGIKRFRELYPEYSDLDDDLLTEKLFAKVGRQVPRADPWRLLFERVTVGIGVPVLVLLFGALVFWAVSGFRQSTIHS